jgi:MFS transporter, AAHS family, vanillate permease
MTALEKALRERPMSAWQVLVVALCILINSIDGFDILALSFAAPVVSREWGLTPQQTGFVFSANLVGIGIGAFAFALVADAIGRRPVILGGTVLMSIGMIATAFTHGAGELAVCRVITGLGIGAMVSTAGTLAIEYSATRWRALSVALVVIGYPVGGTLGGFVTGPLLEHHGWRSVFLFGGALTVALFPLLLWRLPESLAFLIDRQPRDALRKINRYADRLGLGSLASLPARVAQTRGSVQFFELWRAPLLRSTATLCLLYPLFMFTFYFFIQWSTKLATERGLADAQAIRMSGLVSLAGIAGGIVFGLLATRISLTRLVAALATLMAVGIALMGLLPPTVLALDALALVLGFCMWGASATIYSVYALAYPPRVRASGIGLVVTIGRAGSALGPYCAGLMRGAGYDWGTVSVVLAAPAVLAALLLLSLGREIGAPAAAPMPEHA